MQFQYSSQTRRQTELWYTVSQTGLINSRLPVDGRIRQERIGSLVIEVLLCTYQTAVDVRTLIEHLPRVGNSVNKLSFIFHIFHIPHQWSHQCQCIHPHSVRNRPTVRAQRVSLSGISADYSLAYLGLVRVSSSSHQQTRPISIVLLSYIRRPSPVFLFFATYSLLVFIYR